MIKKILMVLGGVLFVFLLALFLIQSGWLGRHYGPGKVTAKPVPGDVISKWSAARLAGAAKLGVNDNKQILFGDLHVHTTISTDAFMLSLPVMTGEGARPAADACDFARYCSALDFWSINDHAGAISPRHWKETVDSIRECNAVADQKNPDVVAFLGYEWTQVGTKARNHYGHKNVIYRDFEKGKTPPRPIAAKNPGLGIRDINAPLKVRLGLPLLDTAYFSRYMDYNSYSQALKGVTICDEGINTKDLPDDCSEYAATPADLFRKLDEGGYTALVIPHGNTWGLYSPRGITWDKQLVGKQHDPKRQKLLEVFSGHGNSEEYRPWRGAILDENGGEICPEPTPSYLPGCWRAGEIVYERCRKAGEKEAACRKFELQARKDFLASGVYDFASIPGVPLEDWQDSEQCRDCFLPSMNYRPGASSQYALAISNFEDLDKDGRPRRFRFGFMASSDIHYARPGTGYKEFGKHGMTEGIGPRNEKFREAMGMRVDPPSYKTRVLEFSDPANVRRFGLMKFERNASYFRTGGLIAAHSSGRDRNSIWNAMERKEVYATSGDRILLWFDMINASKRLPMGGETRMNSTPRFRVRAAGAFKQKPGCPEHSINSLTPGRLNRLCMGECYNPSDIRKKITRIEVIRIRPQIRKGEPVAGLIEDVWKTHKCKSSREGCVFEFSDPGFSAGKRDTVYYVRAIQEASPAVNGDSFRCEYDDKGRCVKMKACYGGYQADKNDGCLAMSEERAWSSPIFVDYGRPGSNP